MYARIPAKEAEDADARGRLWSEPGKHQPLRQGHIAPTSDSSRAGPYPSFTLPGQGPVPLGLGMSFPIRHKVKFLFTRGGSEVFSPRPGPSSGLGLTSLRRG